MVLWDAMNEHVPSEQPRAGVPFVCSALFSPPHYCDFFEKIDYTLNTALFFIIIFVVAPLEMLLHPAGSDIGISLPYLFLTPYLFIPLAYAAMVFAKRKFFLKEKIQSDLG